MSYATYQDLIQIHDERTIIELSDDNGDGVADVAVIDAALAQADAEIHARVSRRFAVPLSPIPALAISLAATLVVGLLHARRSGELATSLKDSVQAAKKLLDRIGEGKADWGESVQPISDTAHMDVRIQSQVRVFNRQTMRGF